MVVRELPKLEYQGKTWFYDVKLNQLRNVDNPHDFIDDPPVRMVQGVSEIGGFRCVTFTPEIYGEGEEFLGCDEDSSLDEDEEFDEDQEYDDDGEPIPDGEDSDLGDEK